MDPMVKARQRIERNIARRFILDAIHAGHALNVNNGGDSHELPAPSTKAKEVLAAMFATDDEHLIVYSKGVGGRWVRTGWVYLVYGNSGWDVVSDHTTNLKDLMKGAMALADRYG
jgi:hypothetical protein